jgi:hypothetical protein
MPAGHPQVVWRAAAFTHRTFERKVGEMRSWWHDYSSRHK